MRQTFTVSPPQPHSARKRRDRSLRWPAVDRGTRTFWTLVGRDVDVTGNEAWLAAPMTPIGEGTDAWLAAEVRRCGGEIISGAADAGLLPDWEGLAGDHFDPDLVHPLIRDFYLRTAQWRMDVWSSWSPLFLPAGIAVSRLFGQRIQQLALPTHPLDVAQGMDSAISIITDSTGTQTTAAWVRTLRSNGNTVFSGAYSRQTLPGSAQPSVHVTFPLEAGNLQVFLRPHNRPEGGLELRSPAGQWGEDGAYVTVSDGQRTTAKRVPIHESFVLYVDDEGVVRTDHHLRFANQSVMRLHYTLRQR